MTTKNGSQPECIILGAGLAGLSAALHLGKRATVYEAQDRPGGECVTDRVGPYHFDKSGHLLHLQNEAMQRWIERLVPGKLRAIKRDARIHIAGQEYAYPFQSNIRGLDSDLKMQALQDFLQAVSTPQKQPKNFLQWGRQQLGDTITRLFLEPYNRKLWTVDPSQLTLDWMGEYMPKPDIARVVRGAFTDNGPSGGYNATFLYPKVGGIERLANAMAKKVNALYLNARAVALDTRRRTVTIMGHGKVTWKKLISTVPLPSLVAMLENPPQDVVKAFSRLHWSSVLVVNLAIARSNIHPAHWLYFPEAKYPFYRVGFPGNFGRVAPSGHSTLYAEVALPAGTGWESREAITKKVRKGLLEAGIVQSNDTVCATHLQYIPYAYVIFDQAYAAARKHILRYFEQCGILCIGRWGHWEYSAMEDALLAGKKAASQIQSKGGQ